MLVKTLLLFNLCFVVHSYKVLFLAPHSGKSHFMAVIPLVEDLAEKGHEVTLLGHFPVKSPNVNFTQIDDTTSKLIGVLDLPSFRGDRSEKWLFTPIYAGRYNKFICEKFFESPSVENFLAKNHSFDVVLTQMILNDCFNSFAYKFKAPLIGVTSIIWMNRISDFTGSIYNPSHVPNVFMEYGPHLSFFERLENLLLSLQQSFYFKFCWKNRGRETAKKYFGGDVPDFQKVNMSVILSDSYFGLTFPKMLAPATIEVGGLHVQGTNLTKNLEKWINESTHGVIYLSLGSMIKGHTLPDEKKQEFLKAFGRLPQRVLWKWENETMPGKPDNVMIQKWMPQLDILCHPNVKAFISHGGLLGTTEAVHCGVPVLVMPQYGDQFTNAKALEANGGGIILHLYELTEEKLYNGLKTILDPKFKKQAEDLSARFRDRPLPPLETAIYWVEYVARHRGAHHMRTAAVGMPLYKYLLLDVIAFLLLVFVLISACFFYVTRAVFRKLFGRRDKQKNQLIVMLLCSVYKFRRE